MTRWMWWAPLIGLTALIAIYAFRLGWIAVHLTESDAITTYAAQYSQATGGAPATDCFAESAEVYGLWLVVRCIDGDSQSLHSYYLNRVGWLRHYAREALADPAHALQEEPST